MTMNKLTIFHKTLEKVIRPIIVRSYCHYTDTIHLSDNCVKKLKTILSNGDNLRIIVEGGGCAGFQYKFELDKLVSEDDRVFEKDNVKVVVDLESFSFIRGSTVDYTEQLIRSAFVITNNPQAAEGCSCGSSFSIKIE